jgi:hypothetical protein
MRVVLAKNAYGTAPNPNLSTSISCFWLVSGRSLRPSKPKSAGVDYLRNKRLTCESIRGRPKRARRTIDTSDRGDSRHVRTAGEGKGAPVPYFKCAFKNRPVCDALHAATSSGVPVTTTSPPAWPPSGPRSMT